MTGRELIVYILENKLEDVPIFNTKLFMDESEAAVTLSVGVATIRAWYDCGMISGIKIGDKLYVTVSGPIVITKS